MISSVMSSAPNTLSLNFKETNELAYKQECLLNAIIDQQTEEIDRLVKEGFDLNFTAPFTDEMLDAIVTQLSDYINLQAKKYGYEADLSVVEFILCCLYSDLESITPLHLACNTMNISAVRLLLEHGADFHRSGISLEGDEGGSYFGIDHDDDGLRLQIAQLLIDHGAHLVDLFDDIGVIDAVYAEAVVCDNTELVQFLDKNTKKEQKLEVGDLKSAILV